MSGRIEDAYRVLGLEIGAPLDEVNRRYAQILAEDSYARSSGGRPRTNLPAVELAHSMILKHNSSITSLLAHFLRADDDDDVDDCYESDYYYSDDDEYYDEMLRDAKFTRNKPNTDAGYRANTDSVAVAASASSLLKQEEEEKQETKKDTKKKKKKPKKKKPQGQNKKNKENVANSNTPSNENVPPTDSDEEGLDPNSAFAQAARSKISDSKPLTASVNGSDRRHALARNSGGQPGADDEPDEIQKQARLLALEGNKLAGKGDYLPAIRVFSQAIKLDPGEYRFLGNRSYCHERLKQYDKALHDAEKAIEINKNWPKGYFRKGRALLGQMKYQEAEEAFEHVLKLDRNVEECSKEIDKIRAYRLMQMGFTKRKARSAVRQFKTQQVALEALLQGDVQDLPDSSSDSDTGAPTAAPSDQPKYLDPKEDPSNVEGLTSLWVGNVGPFVSERELNSLFSRHGAVTSIRMLPDRHCAFVNFHDKRSASLAMQHLQGVECQGQRLKIKFPDRPIVNGMQKIVIGGKKSNPGPSVGAEPSWVGRGGQKLSGPVGENGECYFWRTTGCSFGAGCRYLHVPANKGIDRKPWHRP